MISRIFNGNIISYKAALKKATFKVALIFYTLIKKKLAGSLKIEHFLLHRKARPTTTSFTCIRVIKSKSP